MTYEMIRNNCEYSYLYSSIYANGDYVCDTLEFAHENTLKDGTYTLIIGVDRKKNERIIEIYDFMNNLVSRFVKDNCTMYHNIKMRLVNNHICIGTKVNEPLLVMNQYVAQLLGVQISGYAARREVCYLTISTPENILSQLVPIE